MPRHGAARRSLAIWEVGGQLRVTLGFHQRPGPSFDSCRAHENEGTASWIYREAVLQFGSRERWLALTPGGTGRGVGASRGDERVGRRERVDGDVGRLVVLVIELAVIGVRPALLAEGQPELEPLAHAVAGA